MRLRQGPLLEAAIIYVVSTSVSLVILIATFGANFGAVTNTFTLEAIFLLLPSFVLWVISGQFLKGRSAIARFFTQITINSVIGVAALILTSQVIGAVEADSRAAVTTSMYAVVVAYYLGTLAGSAVCNFWYVLVTNRRS